MRVEITIAREKAAAMPEGAIDALREQMTERLSKRYDVVEVIVKKASNDGLSVMRSLNKEHDKEYVQEILQETWESAEEWFN
ncbi:DinI-like family protein [Pantoea dispersa]|uniref:DinI-like family protein n=1 Tax=Pantoea dispersa TaxID=59814 RepID=UPI0024AECCA2|nr:DinI-like family protein [Pantoea dispersa]MDI6635256.1 DinI-like family protein [Pantoea dispersa]